MRFAAVKTSSGTRLLTRPGAPAPVRTLASLGAVGLVTGAVFALRPVAPVLSLGVLYVFAVLPVAVVWGLPYAIAVSIASMLAFNFFFLPPEHTLALRDSENWVALAVYLVTAIVVSGLAARARRRAAEAEQREREAALLADVSATLLEAGDVQTHLGTIAARAASVLGLRRARIELESLRRPAAGEAAHDLVAGDRSAGRLFVEAGAEPDPAVSERVLPALAALLAAARERERLSRRALETEALRRSDTMKTALLRAASHDLRSPLTAIRAAAEGLGSNSLELGAADRADLLETIRIETKRLERLVVNLLDLSRLEARAAEPRPELWTLDGLVARALDAIGSEAERVVVALPPDSPALRVDGTQIERALANLIENALKFSPPTEQVEIKVESADGEALVRVVDHGPGLRKADLEHVFEPFAHAIRGTARDQGTGLGLAIARGFAEANGGRIWADSQPGAGASFVLAFPLAPVPTQTQA